MKATFEDYTIEYNASGSQLTFSIGEETVKVVEVKNLEYNKIHFRAQAISVLKTKCSEGQIKFQI
jgi:hypothetical protein